MDIDDVNELKIMKEMADKHCSHCAFYDVLPNHTMYCGKLKKAYNCTKETM